MGCQFAVDTYTQKGVRNIIKHIPGESRLGVLSPEALEVLRAAEARGGRPPEGLAALRAGVGWNNRDLTRTEILSVDTLARDEGRSVPVTLYCPRHLREDADTPAIVYFHGGGFFAGSRKTVENTCRLLAERAGAVVASVEYRLCPENRFPAAVDDAWTALRWVFSSSRELKIDRRKIVVAGDSAGGNLATVCALKDRDGGSRMVAFQAMAYPTVTQVYDGLADYCFSESLYVIDDSESRYILPAVHFIELANRSLNELYFVDQRDRASPLASPLLAADLSGMPGTLLLSAEFDFLTASTQTYARRLAQHGVKVTSIVYRGVDHGFLDKCGVYPQAEDAIQEIADAVRAL